MSDATCWRGPLVAAARTAPRLILVLLAATAAGGIAMGSNPEPLPDFDSLWDYDRPESTASVFRGILPAAEASGNRDYLAQLLTQIARAEGLQMRFEDAEKTLGRAASLLTEETPVARVRVLLERGRVLNSSKRGEESKPFFREAWDRARACGAHGLAVDAAHMLAIADPDSSEAWNRTAIDYAEGSSDPKARKWLGSLYNNLGWTYHGRGEFETALDLFRKALEARETQGKKDLIRVARWCVARAERSLERYDEALATQRALLAETEAEGAPDGYVHEEIAECLAALGKDAEAKPHFTAAYEILAKDPWLQRDEPGRLERLRRLGGAAEPETPR